MKKLVCSLMGGVLVLLGMIFIIIPGPSLLLLIPGFYLLSLEYDWAKVWLKRCQKLLKKSATWIDKQFSKIKQRKSARTSY